MKEKTLRIQNREVHYKIAGEGPAIFILHGWGRGSDSWAEVQEKLAEAGYKVIVPDLPGFGKTSPPETIWGVKEYADFAMEFIKKLGADTFFLLGHSFGGQVAVKFAASYPEKLEKLILCAPAAIRKEPGLKEVFITYVAKMGNFVLFFIPIEGLRQFARNVFARIIGRSDYLQAPGIMRKVMQKVIREDLSTFFLKSARIRSSFGERKTARFLLRMRM